MSNENIYITKLKLKEFELKNELKHVKLVKNLRITKNILKIIGTITLATTFAIGSLNIVGVKPFKKQTIKVTELQETIYTQDDEIVSVGNYETIKHPTIILYLYRIENGIKTVKFFELPFNTDISVIVNGLRNNKNLDYYLETICREKKEYHEDVTNNDYSNFKLVIYKTTGNTVERIQTDDEDIAEIAISVIMLFLYNLGLYGIFDIKDTIEKIKTIKKLNPKITKNELLEQLNIVKEDLSLMEVNHGR